MKSMSFLLKGVLLFFFCSVIFLGATFVEALNLTISRTTLTTPLMGLKLALSPDSKTIYVVGNDTTTNLESPAVWSYDQNLNIKNKWKGIVGAQPLSFVATSPDSAYVFAGGSTVPSLSAFNASLQYQRGANVTAYDGVVGVNTTAGATSSYVLYTADATGNNNPAYSISKYNYNNLSLITTKSAGSLYPYTLTLSPDGQYLYVAAFNNLPIQKYRTSDMSLVATFSDSSIYGTPDMAISPNGQYLYVVGYNQYAAQSSTPQATMKKIRTSDMTLVSQLTSTFGAGLVDCQTYCHIAMGPDGNFYTVGLYSTKLQQWDANMNLLQTIDTGTQFNNDVAVSSDNSYVYVLNYTNTSGTQTSVSNPYTLTAYGLTKLNQTITFSPSPIPTKFINSTTPFTVTASATSGLPTNMKTMITT
jgi:6-phosphogluconolactonase (cycloisomerase 2 family)